jgi:antitoxin component YwqK of YwqJK toxin-antitoxin module
MKYASPIVFLVLAVFACGTGEQRRKRTMIKKNDKGTVISVEQYSDQNKLDGISTYYHDNGRRKEEISYSNGLMNGWDIHYFDNGLPSSKINFVNGVRQGTSYWYYPDGKIEEQSDSRNGKQFGPSLFFYPNGRLETFSSFDFEQHNRYLIKYDSTGKLLREEGTVLGQFLLDGSFDS